MRKKTITPIITEVVYVGQNDDGTPNLLDRPQTQDYREPIPDEDLEGLTGREIHQKYERDKKTHKLRRTFGVDKDSTFQARKNLKDEPEEIERHKQAERVFMYEVKSSFVGSVGYYRSTNTLIVRFKPPRSIKYQEALYFYYSVPENIYRAIINSASVGGGLHYRVFDKYRYKRISAGASLLRPSWRQKRKARLLARKKARQANK